MIVSAPPVQTVPQTRRVSQPVALALGFIILTVISLASIFLVNRSREDAAEVAQTLLVENQLSRIQSLVLRAESSQRGYMLTGDQAYLSAFDGAIEDVGTTLDQIRMGARERSGRRAPAEQLTTLVQAKVDELRHTITLRRSGDDVGALAVIRTDRGEKLTRSITDVIEQMQQQEEQVLAARSAASHRSGTWLLVVNLAGVAAIAVIAAIALRLTRRASDALRQAHRQVENANVILERRVAERTADLQEANNEIQSFAYIVSHDLRSPLVNIMGFTSELENLRTDLFFRLAALRDKAGETDASEDEAMNRDFEEAFGFIKASITKMDRLINAILELSRQGRKEFVATSVDMTELVEGIAATMAHQLMDRSARVTVAKIPPITSDRLALEQIFTNLIDNAVKYLRADVPGLIEVSAKETAGYVTYLVRDNGRGIDPADRTRVFELFRRSGPQDRPGEGIGLAHVRTLVRRLGGGITLESELGQGTVFKITLPRKLAQDGNERTDG